MQIDPKGLEAAKAEGYALGVHEGRVELIVRAYLSALSPAMLVDMGSGRRWMTPALSPAGTASEMEPVAWEGYWDGAGSISSETRYTRSIAAMERWAADGAKITPLYALPPKTEGWQPIETAPKDETNILVVEKDGMVTVARWVADVPEDEGFYEMNTHPADIWSWGTPLHPTHWMPLPAPPSAPVSAVSHLLQGWLDRGSDPAEDRPLTIEQMMLADDDSLDIDDWDAEEESWTRWVGPRVREVWNTLPPELRERIIDDAADMAEEAWHAGIDAMGDDA